MDEIEQALSDLKSGLKIGGRCQTDPAHAGSLIEASYFRCAIQSNTCSDGDFLNGPEAELCFSMMDTPSYKPLL